KGAARAMPARSAHRTTGRGAMRRNVATLFLNGLLVIEAELPNFRSIFISDPFLDWVPRREPLRWEPDLWSLQRPFGIFLPHGLHLGMDRLCKTFPGAVQKKLVR